MACQLCLPPHRLTAWCGAAILVRCGVVHHSVPVPDLTHLKATAIHVTLAGKPVVILAAYLSFLRPLIGAYLTACFHGGLMLWMVGNVSAKHVNWNSRFSTRRVKLTWLYRRELLSDLCARHFKHKSIQPLYSRYLGRRDDQEHFIPSISDFVLFTKVGPRPCTHWHDVSLIISPPTRSPSSGALTGSTSRKLEEVRPIRNCTTKWQSKCVLRTPGPFLRLCQLYSQVSPVWRTTTSYSFWVSGWDTS